MSDLSDCGSRWSDWRSASAERDVDLCVEFGEFGCDVFLVSFEAVDGAASEWNGSG